MNICAECKHVNPDGPHLGLPDSLWTCLKGGMMSKNWGQSPVTGQHGWISANGSICIDKNDGTCAEFESKHDAAPLPSRKDQSNGVEADLKRAIVLAVECGLPKATAASMVDHIYDGHGWSVYADGIYRGVILHSYEGDPPPHECHPSTCGDLFCRVGMDVYMKADPDKDGER